MHLLHACLVMHLVFWSIKFILDASRAAIARDKGSSFYAYAVIIATGLLVLLW